MHFIITGASGAIGYALLKKLSSDNHKITVLINPDSKRNDIFKNFKSIKVLECSILDYRTIDINDKFDVFIHMAWRGGNDRNNIFLNNTSSINSVEAVELANRLDCKLFIGTGSQAEYGYQNTPLDENTLCKPDTSFGAAKLSSYHYTKFKCREYGINHLWLRIGSVYGPFDRESTILLSTIRKVKNKEIPAFSDGNQYWDFLYSDDLANAILQLIYKNCSGLYIVGEGLNLKLKDYLLILSTELGIRLLDSIGKAPIIENQVTPNLRINPSKIIKDASWTPNVKFKNGLKKLINYSNDHDIR